MIFLKSRGQPLWSDQCPRLLEDVQFRFGRVTRIRRSAYYFTLVVIGVVISLGGIAMPAIEADSVRFAVIGDYGSGNDRERGVANLVKSWKPDFIITTGDNNYPSGEAATIDQNIGQYYHEFIAPYRGSYGEGADTSRFFPSLGNHDWRTDNAIAYLDYFTLPRNERYYDFRWGPVQFFAVDSDVREPDGITSTSIQAQWLQSKLASSTAIFKFVYFHHAPYSSGTNGSTIYMRWPFTEWGADAVLSGHDHDYERINLDDIVYFVNGLGGAGSRGFGEPVDSSQVRYRNLHGAMLVEITSTIATFQFITRTGEVIDSYTIDKSVPTSVPEEPLRLKQFTLEQNYPNPFNPETKISYEVSTKSFVTIKIYNLLSKEVTTLVSEKKVPGSYEVKWDGRNLKGEKVTSGIYLYKLEILGRNNEHFSETKKMILLH